MNSIGHGLREPCREENGCMLLGWQLFAGLSENQK
jgi:hypothetical protein